MADLSVAASRQALLMRNQSSSLSDVQQIVHTARSVLFCTVFTACLSQSDNLSPLKVASSTCSH